jgi:hypothetical protein
MPEEPLVSVYPQGFEGESPGWPDGPPIAVLTRIGGVRLELRFAPGDFRGEGLVQELRLLPDSEQLEPRVLRRFAPQAELYLAFARAAMRIFGPEDDPVIRREKLHAAAMALREISGPGRGLTDEFYQRIAEEYAALIDGGEPHPVKALGEIHCVTISAASRWITEGRRRGYIDAKETTP